jgi:hypothetical protein
LVDSTDGGSKATDEQKKIYRRSKSGGGNAAFNITIRVTQGIDVTNTWFDISGFGTLIASLRIDEKYVSIFNF